MGRGFAALRYRNYRLFFCGQLISVTGTWMQSLAQSWLVVDQLHASAFQLGLVNVFQFGPVLLLGIPAGVIADKIPKRTLMLCSQTIFGLLAAVLAVLVASGHVQLWHVYLLAGLFGLTNAFDMPARQAFVSEMVDREALMNAIALNSAMFNTGRILGPAIAGVILAAFGPAVCFAINAVSYIAVIAGLLMMRVKPLVGAAAGTAADKLREGLTYVRRTPDVLRPVLLVAFVGVFGMSFNVWLPLLARDSFHADAGTFGLLFSSMGAGSLAGALAIAFFGREPSRTRMLLAATALGLAEIGVAVAASVPLAVGVGMLLLAACGFSASNAMAMANTIVQTTAPDELRGRVMAVYSTVFMGSTPIGALVAGSISEKAGVVTSMIIGGVVVALAAITLTWLQRESTPTPTPLAVPVSSATTPSQDVHVSPVND
ncbi:MAG TPA: MFS transporter [Thermomicrobiales bacterium]|jgi:MFS family permease|nr:MFS transporter [Thermomicrobiales bacterium]